MELLLQQPTLQPITVFYQKKSRAPAPKTASKKQRAKKQAL